MPTDPQRLAVTPEHFDQHLDALKTSGQPVSLAQLADALRERTVPRRAIAITFDDGYADNLYSAKPLLERHDTPATVFVTTGHLRRNREFWWDELERLVLQPGSLPDQLRVTINGSTLEWRTDVTRPYTEADFCRHREWHIERTDHPTARQVLYRSLYRALHPLGHQQREQVLTELRHWAGVAGDARPTHRSLTIDEVVQLDHGGLVEVGAHTVNHPALAVLPAPAQTDEIRSSKTGLEEILEHPVTSFAYPHGAYTPETVATVREIGFLRACTSRPDTVWPAEHRFELPRVVVRDWDGDEFAHWIRGWLDG